jgi:hypothetical protein
MRPAFDGPALAVMSADSQKTSGRKGNKNEQDQWLNC